MIENIDEQLETLARLLAELKASAQWDLLVRQETTTGFIMDRHIEQEQRHWITLFAGQALQLRQLLNDPSFHNDPEQRIRRRNRLIDLENQARPWIGPKSL